MGSTRRTRYSRGAMDERKLKQLSLEYIRRVLRERNQKASQLANDAGLYSTTLTRPLNRPDHPHGVSLRTLLKIRDTTGIDLPDELARYATEHGEPTRTNKGHSLDRGMQAPIEYAKKYGYADLPVFGHAQMGEDRIFMDNGNVQAWIPRPDRLAGVDSGYAVYANGDSMSPRFEHGWTVYVNPIEPPRSGDDVVIELDDQQAYIKRLVKITDSEVRCKQFNPEREIAYPRERVAQIHRIVSCDNP